MSFPSGQDYVSAVQNPKIVFSDIDLKNSSVETTKLGLPNPYSGGFTTTFHLLNGTNSWAVRCFTKQINDLETRYSAIHKYLMNKPADFFVNAELLNQGIRIRNSWYPIIKMDWLKGETLYSFISKNANNSTDIKQVLATFTDVAKKIEALGIAHGDLQHGNILVKNKKLYLIDYDGMFLPSLSHLKINEIGHINYQHPSRTPSYCNNKMDRFSAIVIYMALKTISDAPSFWTKYEDSESLLFKNQDFINPESSRLIADLFNTNNLKPFIERFCGVCKLNIDEIPSLETFITGNFLYPKITIKPLPGKLIQVPSRSQYLIIDAANTSILFQNIGNRVDVIGQVSNFFEGSTRFRKPYMFLNFGKYPNQSFSLVFWSEIINLFNSVNKDPLMYVNKWIKVTGVITTYKNKPNMMIESPSQIQIFPSKQEALLMLNKSQKSNVAPVKSEGITKTTSPKIFVNPQISGSNLHSNIPSKQGSPLNITKQQPSQQPPSYTQKSKSSYSCILYVVIFLIILFLLSLLSKY